MPIDWFTVAAQVLNFLILVWLMKRFLYKPILDAIDAREQRIAAELASADAKKAEAKQEFDRLQKKNMVFDQERAALLGKVNDEAKIERERLLEQARQAADLLSAKRLEDLQRDEQNLHQEIIRRTQEEVFAIARKTLADLAGASLEERMTQVFIQRLRALDEDAKATMASALEASSAPVRVRSAFDLPEAQRGEIQQVLNETFKADVRLRFQTAADLVSGIELIAHGQKVVWSIDEYLRSLESAVGERLKAEGQSQAKGTSGPQSDEHSA